MNTGDIFNTKTYNHKWFLVSVFVVIFLFSTQEIVNYQKSIENIRKETNNLTILLTKKIENDFERVENILVLAKDSLLNLEENNHIYKDGNFEDKQNIISNKLKIFANSFHEIEDIILIDKEGDIKNSSKKVNVSDRDYFKRFKNNINLNRGFSEIIVSRLSGNKSFLQIIAIRDENKNFKGILAAIINIDLLNKTLSSINIGKEGFTLLGNLDSTTLLARFPLVDDELLNKPIVENNISSLIKSGLNQSCIEYESPIDGIKRFTSFIVMEQFPFYVQVSLSQDEYMINWRNSLIAKSIFLILFIVASVITFISMRKNYKNEQNLLKKLEIAKNRFENMFRIHSSIMLLIDPQNGQILDANQSAVDFYGYSLDELKNMNIKQINQLSAEEIIKKYTEAEHLKVNSFIFEHKIKSGAVKVVEVSSSPIETTSGIILFSIIKDITKEKKIENRLKESYKNIEKLIDLQDNIIILTNIKEIKFANRKFFDFFGFLNLSDFKKHHNCICEFFIKNESFYYVKDFVNKETWIEELKSLDSSKRVVSMRGKYLKEYKFFVTVNSFEDDVMIVSFTDISNTIKEKIKLEIRVTKDILTNAYNREYFEKNYKNWIEKAEKLNHKLAIAMLDIDHFKYVNDSFGHDVGDLVLIDFVKVIKQNLRKDDIFIRWGGEEFILILNINHKSDLEKILENLRQKVEENNFPKVGKRTCSFGGAIYEKGEDILKTVKRADESMYEAKNRGRNKVVINS